MIANRLRSKKEKGKYKYPNCKRTLCKNMGFTQKASCRPYKNCYKTRRIFERRLARI